MCGAVAGGVAAGMTTPMDVTKTRIMLAKVYKRPQVCVTLYHVICRVRIVKRNSPLLIWCPRLWEARVWGGKSSFKMTFLIHLIDLPSSSQDCLLGFCQGSMGWVWADSSSLEPTRRPATSCPALASPESVVVFWGFHCNPLDDLSQWFAAKGRALIRERPRALSFCGYLFWRRINAVFTCFSPVSMYTIYFYMKFDSLKFFKKSLADDSTVGCHWSIAYRWFSLFCCC